LFEEQDTILKQYASILIEVHITYSLIVYSKHFDTYIVQSHTWVFIGI
jgi:hypothetical protein